MTETPTLYVCHGDDGGPRINPCRRVQEKLRERGIAYEKVVARLLASKEYAERQANVWMDLARYADTRGGLNDNDRPISYPYRDWVITAFERNMPYDKFVTWQLAGDKLPGASREQILATAFLKEGRQDSEGGAIDEEFRMNYVEERTELIGKDFLGLTVGCAKCHNHKYDVIAQADYYSIAAIFNQMDERGGGSFGANPADPGSSAVTQTFNVYSGDTSSTEVGTITTG